MGGQPVNAVSDFPTKSNFELLISKACVCESSQAPKLYSR
jgi:hypothetical protein